MSPSSASSLKSSSTGQPSSKPWISYTQEGQAKPVATAVRGIVGFGRVNRDRPIPGLYGIVPVYL